MTITVNNIWYVNYGNGSSTGHYAVTQWSAGATNTAGQIKRQLTTPAVGSERCFVCIVAGTSANPTEPTWVVTKGAKTTDNTTTWMECTGLPALNNDLTDTPLSSANRSGAQVLGNLIKNNAATYYFICTTAGTTGAGEPTYVTTAGSTTVDSGCTWTCLGAVGGFVTAWGAPMARLGLALNNASWAASGDTVYVSSSHAETQASGITWSAGSLSATTSVLCTANGGTIPPGTADLTTGAAVSATAGSNIIIGSYLYFRGITFNVGSGVNSAQFNIATSSNGWVKFESCAIIGGATSSVLYQFGASAGSQVELINTPITFANTNSQAIRPFGRLIWRDTASAVASTAGTWPTALFGPTGAGTTWIENVDVSGFGGANLAGNTIGTSKQVFNRCKLPAGIVAVPALGGAYSPQVDLINCDSAGATYRHERWAFEGTQTISITAVRTSGASDGTTAYAWQIAANSGAKWIDPFECLPILIWNAVTGANVTVTIEAAYNGAALPNNDDIWIDVRYLGTASSSQGALISETKANVLAAGSPLSASSALWGGAAAARQNSHAYVIGDQIAATGASSIVRLFICTTGGTSSGSLPGAYASAVDGGSVTDGTAVLRAVMRFQMAVTLTGPQPQSAGSVTAYVRVAKASSTFWVDPLITLS